MFYDGFIACIYYNMFFLLVASLVTMKTDLNINDTNSNSSVLVYNIRRQLMQDNYDYLPTGSEDSVNRNDENEYIPPEKNIDDYDYHEHDKQRFNMTEVESRAHDYEVKDQNKVNDQLSKNDLLYYLNDDRIGLGNDYGDDGDAKVKYKVIKVKSAHPNRRSLAVRRFIQERGQDGVALMSLDDEPFPDFKLPKSRRQYMQETSENEDTENLMEDFSFEDY